jgi:hypothetical protein
MRLLLVLTVLMLTACASALSPVRGKQLSIAGIAPGATLADVLRKLGPALKVESASGSFTQYVSYDRLSFALDEDGLVANANTSNPRYCFNHWLCPGMSLSAARAKIPNLSQSPSGHGNLLVAYSNGSGCWLEVDPSGDVISSLAIACQP